MINTVLGPVSANDLGKTLMHEHFVFGYPGYSGDITLGPFDREKAIQTGIDVAERLKSYGVKTVIDATPNECGRDPELLKEISSKTGINIICATGYYCEAVGAPPYFRRRMGLGDAQTEVYEMFMKEITDGIANTGIKPGIIKLASSQNQITDYERMFFKAAARVQAETGITLVTHTQVGTMGPEQAELLISEGADPGRIIIGHMCGNTDISYHVRTLNYGVTIAFDRFGLQGMVGAPMDELRVACLVGLIGIGYGNRIVCSHDKVITWLGRYQPYPEEKARLTKNWHTFHLFENIVPLLKRAGITQQQIDALFEDNIRRAFGGD